MTLPDRRVRESSNNSPDPLLRVLMFSAFEMIMLCRRSDLVMLQYLHEQATAPRDNSNASHSVLWRHHCTDTVAASAGIRNRARRSSFRKPHPGWAIANGCSRFETACEYRLRREEGRSHCYVV